MSEIHPIEVPKWGMTMEEGTIGEWQVAEGEAFSKGAPLCTIESSKISNELEAPFDGFLRRIVVGIGDTLPVGALIAVSADPSVPDSEVDAFIAEHTPAGSAPATPAAAPAVAVSVAAAPGAAPAGACATDEGGSATCTTSGPAAATTVGAGQGGAGGDGPGSPGAAKAGADAGAVVVPESLRGTTDDSVFATPHARAFAEEHGIDLGAITGSGRAGRVSLADVESAVTAAGGRVPARVPALRGGGPARSTQDDAGVPATPVARRLAGELGVNLHDCRTTGRRGRVCRLDVEEAARRFAIPLPGDVAAPSSGSSSGSSTTGSSTTASGGAPAGSGTAGGTPGAPPAPEAVPFSPMRRTIGSRLQASYQTSPHFRVRQEIVLDELLTLRRSINAAVPGVRISVNDLVVKAAGLALVRVPEVNVQFDEASQSVLRFPHADVAVAVAVPDGLITPIVRSVDTRSLSEVSGDLAGLITRAKAGKLTPDEFQGGTFTVSNLGMFGVSGFDAIINPPQAAILAVGAGLRRPVVDGDGAVVVRTVMEVTLSGDHRVIDGATGASFVGELKAILESPTQMLV